MEARGELRIDPGRLEDASGSGAELELVIPYTCADETRAVMERAAALTKGLNARISLVAVHAVPYASTYGCPSSTHAFLVARLLELSGASSLPVTAQVVLADSQEDGFAYALKPGSTVLLGCRKHLWRTREERMARRLAEAGHNVSVVYLE